MQKIAPSGPSRLPVMVLQGVPAPDRAPSADQLSAGESRQPFDLTCGPLLRITLLRLTQTEHILLLTMHHIIADGWSIGVLIRELTACYTAQLSGDDPRLPALPIQYADYTIWQREWLQGAVWESVI